VRHCSAWRSRLATEPKFIEKLQDGRVLKIALNRPEKRNALNVAMCHELVNAIDHANEDHSVGAIVLHGNGPVFCAGMDLKEAGAADQVEMARIHERLFTTVQRIRTPLIAAAHGAALAGGTGLAANAHILYATPECRFGLTEIRLALWPVMIFRAVQHAIGERRAVELSLTGREFKSAEALYYGLVTDVVEDPLARAMETAQQIAAFSPIAVGCGLDYVHQVRGRDWDHAGRVGREIRDRLIASADFKEGTAAFLEKREPVWPSLK
jgi:enoyl-CoA hydratase/carnithine racemase